MKKSCHMVMFLAMSLILLISTSGQPLANYVHSGAKCTPATATFCATPPCLVFYNAGPPPSCQGVRGCSNQNTPIVFNTCQQFTGQSLCTQNSTNPQTVNCGNGQGFSVAIKPPATSCAFQGQGNACSTGTAAVSCGAIPDCVG